MLKKILKKHKRVRGKISGTSEVPRVSVYKSIRYMYVQLIDDEKSVSMYGLSDKVLTKKNNVDEEKGEKGSKKNSKIVNKQNKTDRSYQLGLDFGKHVISLGFKKVCFDRGGHAYHGRIASFAKGARDAGLIF